MIVQGVLRLLFELYIVLSTFTGFICLSQSDLYQCPLSSLLPERLPSTKDLKDGRATLGNPWFRPETTASVMDCALYVVSSTVISLPTINTSTTVLHHTRPVRTAPNHTSTLCTMPDQSVTRQPSPQHAIPCRDTPPRTV